MKNKNTIGHCAALFTILVWGTTFISTKILLTAFQPVEILIFRFIMGFCALWIAAPKRLRTANAKQELTFAAAGLCGICLYYLLENIALTYTLASNVGVIVSVTPFLTAILAHLFIQSPIGGAAQGAVFPRISGCHGRDYSHQLQWRKIKAEPHGRSACNTRGVGMGILFHSDKENHKLLLSCDFCDKKNLLLRDSVHAPDAVLL